jgi:hypothetical protein
VWISADGITWSRLPHDEAVFGGNGAMLGVASGGAGLVAVGNYGDAPLWTSPDGVSWSRFVDYEGVFRGGDHPEDVAAGGPGLVAVGHGAVWVGAPQD